jgi:branched-chain amino acid transport system substrate-binding protein
MLMTRRGLLGAASLAAPLLVTARSGRAQAPVIRIGVLTDESGPYSDTTGIGSYVCGRQAADEFGIGHGFTIEVIHADHQNKPDIGANIVRHWYDRDGVDMVLDVPTSSVALAIAGITKEKNKAFVASGTATADLTGAHCSPNTVHWTYDTYMLARSIASQLVKLGGNKWFFITANYVFGHQLERDAARFVQQAGGSVLGRDLYPFPGTTDFSSYLLKAQSSGANVIGLAMSGSDAVNCVKQAHEFGLAPQMTLAALLAQPADIEAMGAEIAQRLYLTSTFYWDLNGGTRAFTRKVQPQLPKQRPPNMIQAGCYAGTMHYLKAVAALGAANAKADGAAVVAQMKAIPIQDEAFGSGRIREDGRALFPVYLLQVKPPEESKSKWDLLKVVATAPADQAWRPISEGACVMVKS